MATTATPPADDRVENFLKPNHPVAPAERYYSREYARLEEEKLWPRTWQIDDLRPPCR